MDLINLSFDQKRFSENNKLPLNVDDYEVNKKVLSDHIKIIHIFMHGIMIYKA